MAVCALDEALKNDDEPLLGIYESRAPPGGRPGSPMRRRAIPVHHLPATDPKGELTAFERRISRARFARLARYLFMAASSERGRRARTEVEVRLHEKDDNGREMNAFEAGFVSRYYIYVLSSTLRGSALIVDGGLVKIVVTLLRPHR